MSASSDQSGTCDGSFGPRLLLPPEGDEDGDVSQPFVPEPVHCQLEALTRKHLLVAMATKTQKPELTIKNKKNSFFFCVSVHAMHTHLFSLFSGS